MEAERVFLEWAHQQSRPEDDFIERSGTCAIIVLIIGDICYVANVGDSRAIMSVDGGEKILLLSKDHKPEDDEETKRVEENGGQIYQNKSYVPDPSPENSSGVQMIVGPHRVFPGRLSVSRTIGDIEAKDVRYGGNPRCVVPTPDIKSFKIRPNYDFIVIGCDGVFEKLDNKQVINASWEAAQADWQNDEVVRRNIDPNVIKTGIPASMHQKAGLVVDKVLHECVNFKTLDNITAVMIAFNNFEAITSPDEPQLLSLEEQRMANQRRSLEPIEEEYIISEAETPTPEPTRPKSNLDRQKLMNTQPIQKTN
jgi:serine/threonine protein phosphatase PrpC